MNRGVVILATNTDSVDYVKCATKLKNSIKNLPVTIITSDMLPHGDLGGYQNDWQVYECSPYDYTLKLEADMFIPNDISFYFDILKDRDIHVCSTIRNFKNEISDVRYYRKFIDDNNLPDVYNAITYFKKSESATLFFSYVREFFENWEEYKSILKCNTDEPASTDWVYALACHIMGIEKTTMPIPEISMVHMKQHINNTLLEDWTKELVYEYHDNILKINTVPQRYPFHYHIKSFSEVL